MQATRLPTAFDRPARSAGGPVPTPTCCCCCCCCASTLASWAVYGGVSAYHVGRRSQAPHRAWGVVLGIVAPLMALGVGIGAATAAEAAGLDDLSLLVPGAVLAALAWFAAATGAAALAGMPGAQARKVGGLTALFGTIAFAAELVVGVFLLFWTAGIGYLALLAGAIVGAVVLAQRRYGPRDPGMLLPPGVPSMRPPPPPGAPPSLPPPPPAAGA